MPPEIQGHRGARGLLPENTIASFCLAFDLGVDAVELDVVVAADDTVVVSHEPWFNPETCSDPEGNPIPADRVDMWRILDLTRGQITAFDCGRRGHPAFPEQRPQPACKPTLAEVIAACDAHCERGGRPAPRYNVEVKARPDWDGVYTPEPVRFAELVAATVAEAGAEGRAMLQSFDPRLVERFHALGGAFEIGLLVENDWSFEGNVGALSFTPDAYNPAHELVDAELVSCVHQAGMRLVTWTVNTIDEMRRLHALGVDGIITDYPDRAAACFGLPRSDR